MFKLKDILKACVCSFCENIYGYKSIDEKEFIEFLKDFLYEEDLQDYLERYSADAEYDYVDIDNIVNNLSFTDKSYRIDEISSCCKSAFLRTVQTDKTINVEALVDNVVKEFIKS